MGERSPVEPNPLGERELRGPNRTAVQAADAVNELATGAHRGFDASARAFSTHRIRLHRLSKDLRELERARGEAPAIPKGNSPLALPTIQLTRLGASVSWRQVGT